MVDSLKNIKKSLTSLDLNSNQAEVYLALISLGKATPSQISKVCKVTRTSIYDCLTVLVTKGLVEEGIDEAKKVFMALPPENLKLILDQKVTEIGGIIDFLKKSYNNNSAKPHIYFFEGKKGYKKMHDLSLFANRDRETRFLGDIDAIYLALGKDYIQKYLERRIKKCIKNRVISTDEILEHKDLYSRRINKQNLRRVRYLPSIGSMKTSLFNYDDTVWIVPTPKQKFLIMIENAEFAETFKNLFNFLWEIAKQVD